MVRVLRADISAFARERLTELFLSFPDHGFELDPVTLGCLVEEFILLVRRGGLSETAINAYLGLSYSVVRAEGAL